MNPHETTEMMPPLPPDSSFERTETLCGKFRKPGNEDHRDEEDLFIDCWDGKQEQFDALQQMDPWARNAPKSVPDVKSCLSVNFPVGSVCQKLGVHSQQLPTTPLQNEMSSKGEGQPDEILEEAAPNSNSNDEEWWPDEVELNAVTIDNISIDSEPVETDGRRGRYREITVDSGAGEAVVNPDDWPDVDVKGSVKRTRYVGPGGEKTVNLGELTVKVRTK